ncbi:MAG TPA: hypothetical protein VLH56_11505 [Dissulfurispiraceae bacterium]|nr:hypothetical protein [Dissulfurispiraceae bacterium]
MAHASFKRPERYEIVEYSKMIVTPRHTHPGADGGAGVDSAQSQESKGPDAGWDVQGYDGDRR